MWWSFGNQRISQDHPKKWSHGCAHLMLPVNMKTTTSSICDIITKAIGNIINSVFWMNIILSQSIQIITRFYEYMWLSWMKQHSNKDNKQEMKLWQNTNGGKLHFVSVVGPTFCDWIFAQLILFLSLFLTLMKITLI